MFETTILFRDIFPTYEDFAQFIKDEQIDSLALEVDVAFAQFCYRILYREYMNSNIQYDTAEEFKADFANVFEEHFAQYKYQSQLIGEVQELTPADYELIGKRLQNYANNPNTIPDDPTLPLSFISSQVYEQTTDNRLRAYLDAINKMPSTRQKEFISRFRSLFKSFYQTDYYYYEDNS